MRRQACILLLVCCSFAQPSFAHHIKVGKTKLMPVTASLRARRRYETAMADYENLHLERANQGWRAAVKADPNFALAYAWIAFNSRNPAEATAARKKATLLAAKATPGEKLEISWITSVQSNHFLAGIAAMNDMLEMYPHDKRLYYLAGNWLTVEDGNDQAERLFEHALALDNDYPAALNDIAYVYAHQLEFDKALAAMEHYVAVLPNEPNPHDSYAEILRMSGNFEGALEHYRDALKIDREFVSSQLGLADTYAVMGEESRARDEYAKAIEQAHTDADRLDYGLQSATTWVREGNKAEADKAFAAVAMAAHAKEINLEEAQAYRFASMYQNDDAIALAYLRSAEDALKHSTTVAQSDGDEERARILRYRAVRAAHAGNRELADKTVAELDGLVNSSRSRVIQNCLQGTIGALLMMKTQYAEAIPHLEEDHDNPPSLQLLVEAFARTGADDKKREAESRLRATSNVGMEQALFAAPVRDKQASR